MPDEFSLPIDAIEDVTRTTFRDRQRSVVIAPTGSGKSTRLPGWAADELGCRVVVVEPRRVACRSLARFLSRTRGEKAGQYYGYCVRFDARYSNDTRVVFVTPGVALNWLIDGQLEGCAVILDEFHERSVDNDLLAATLLTDDSKIQHLTLTSATVDGEKFANQIDAKLLESEGRSYPVDTEWLAEPSAPTERELDERIVRAVRKLRSEGVDGGILVFLPTYKTIRSARSAIEGAFGGSEKPMAVHGSMPMRELERAFDQSEDSAPIFLATNVAETSLTIPGIRAVVDSGLVKQRLHRAGRSALAVVATSHASMEQRAGRAGRVAAGRAIRLFARRFRAQPFTAPEIEREPLDNLILGAARLGYDGEQFWEMEWLTEPPEHAVVEARERLVLCGLLDEEGHLTERGRDAGAFPVSAHLAPVLALGEEEVRPALADLVALLEVGGRLFRGGGSQSAQEMRADWVSRSPFDVYDEVLALREGRANAHGLHRDVLNEARRVANQLREQLGVSEEVQGDRRPLPAPEDLARPFVEGWPQCVFVERARVDERERKRRRSVAWTNGDVEISVDTEDVHIRKTDPPQYYQAGLVLDHEWVQGKGVSVRGFARTVFPLRLASLRDFGLGEETVSGVHLDKKGGSIRITAQVERRIGKVTLAATREPLTGDPLCQAAADFIMENRLVKGAAEEVKRALHTLSILDDWPEKIGGREINASLQPPSQWIADKLAELGVRESSDLLLVEKDDIVPDLAEQTGLPFWEIEPFQRDFPMVWEHLGAEYRTEVRARSRKVILTPVNRAAKDAGEPSKKVVPSFRGFAVHYHQASRKIRIR